MMENYNQYGLFIFFLILLSYLLIFFVQYNRINKENSRLIVLNTRIALFLPFYAFFMYISLLFPDAFLLLKIPYNIIEAYSFYLFFSLLVCNFKTVKNLLLILYIDSRSFICCYNHKNYLGYYQKLLTIFYHFLITRSVFIVLSVVFSYLNLRFLVMFFEFSSTVILFYSLIHIVLLYENLFRYCKNLYGIMKFFLLKVSVGTVVIMGLVQTFLIEKEVVVFEDDDEYNQVEKIQRTYYMLSLLIFFILTLPYLYAFTYQIIPLDMSSILSSQAFKQLKQEKDDKILYENSLNELDSGKSSTNLKKKIKNSTTISPLYQSVALDISSSGKFEEEFHPNLVSNLVDPSFLDRKVSMLDFLCQILHFSDVFGALDLDENEDYECLNHV